MIKLARQRSQRDRGCTGRGTGHVLTVFAWNKGATKQVAYVGADNHIHELYVGLTGPWRHADLTAMTGAAPIRIIHELAVSAGRRGGMLI